MTFDMLTRRQAAALFGFSLASLAAPRSARAQSAAPLSVGLTFLASGLDPAQGSTGWALVSHGVAEQLFRVSEEGRVVPNLAGSASRDADGVWTIELAPDRFFSDGAPVTAEAVAACLNRSGEANPSARASAGRIVFDAVASTTLTATTEQPTAILPSVLAEWAFPIYKQNGDAFLFTGPFAIEAFEPGAVIEMAPNAHYAGAAERPKLTLRKISDGQALALALAAGEIDMAFHLPVETLSMFEGSDDAIVKSFPVAYQYMMWMNTQTPALADERVRQAIAMGVSREDLVRAARAGVPATGAFADAYPFAADVAPPHDPEAAAALLDAAGWTLDDDGVRRKDGAALELTLFAYPQRPDLVTFQPVVRAALAELGVSVATQITDAPSDAAQSGGFDLFLWAQHTAPAGDPGLFLSLFFETGAARNYTGWSDPAYDALVAELRAEIDPEARIRIAQEAQTMIAEAAPVAFLVTPEWHVGLSTRLADYALWGSDYYVIRPDLGVAS